MGTMGGGVGERRPRQAIEPEVGDQEMGGLMAVPRSERNCPEKSRVLSASEIPNLG